MCSRSIRGNLEESTGKVNFTQLMKKKPKIVKKKKKIILQIILQPFRITNGKNRSKWCQEPETF